MGDYDLYKQYSTVPAGDGPLLVRDWYEYSYHEQGP